MKCPHCEYSFDSLDGSCNGCGADLGYLRHRIYVGQQFAFFEASDEEPIVATLVTKEARRTECRFTELAIVSRHACGLELGLPDDPARPRWHWYVALLAARSTSKLLCFENWPIVELPKLGLIAVVTDRKIYRPGEAAFLCVAAPGLGKHEVQLGVKRLNQPFYQARVMLDASGLCLHRLPDLEPGEHAVMVTVPDRPEAQAQSRFHCAEFSLSPLAAKLKSHQFEVSGENLRFDLRLHLSLLANAYTGQARLALRGGNQVLSETDAPAANGEVSVSFSLDYSLLFRSIQLMVEIRTPEGYTASLPIPFSSWDDRQKISLSPLDPPAAAALVPFRGAQGPVRGLYYGAGREEDMPFALPEVVADKGRIVARRGAKRAQVLVFNAGAGSDERHEFRDIKVGGVLEFPIQAPHAVFTLGAFMERGLPFEAWGVILKPEQIEVSLSAPATAMPGDGVVLELQSNVPSQCLLVVHDARIEHENAAEKLASKLHRHLAQCGEKLWAGRVQELGASPCTRPRAVDFGSSQTEDLEAETLSEAAARSPQEITEPRLISREEFPELAHIEILPVDGRITRSIRLGDQIGRWRCHAYFFHGYDFRRVTQEIEAWQDFYAELDVPGFLAEGDRIHAQVHYHASAEAQLTIRTPEATYEHSVSGDGTVEFLLTRAGEVTAEIRSDGESDSSMRRVQPAGIETVTVSRLALLHPGEIVQGRRVVVFPRAGDLLQETIEALIHYPFG